LSLVGLTKVRSSVEKTVSASKLQQVTVALLNSASDNNGKLPPQVHPDSGLDWSGQLVTGGYIESEVFHAPADRRDRRQLAPPAAINGLFKRSYAVNSAKFTFDGNGYRTPWSKVRTESGAPVLAIPGHVILVGENFGGVEGSGGYVGVAESEGLDAFPRDLYQPPGAYYSRANGSVFFASAAEMAEYRADTDYNGDPLDPWKWK